MIQNKCLICHNDSKDGVDNIHDKKYSDCKENFERILKRKLCVTRFEEKQICPDCIGLMESLLVLEEKVYKIVSKLKGNFDTLHPLKRGRKKKEDIKVTDVEVQNVNVTDSVRKSSRKRKVKEFEELFFVDTDDALDKPQKPPKIVKPEIVSSMATKCPFCDFAADSEAEIERHLRKTHSADGKAFACEHCGKSFALKTNLELHQKTHNLDKPFGCDKCDKTYKQRNSLREHVLKSHDNISKFMCSTCLEKFPSRHLLKIHERTHSGDEGFVCDECGDTFSGKQALEFHMSKHNGQYNFVCPHCQKGFNCKTVFYEHTLTHSGSKPYECQICGAKFSNRGTFWAHKKRHDNPKPYKCQTCEKSFTHSSHLAVHKRTHTGEKPYKCSYCTFCSASATNLKTHMKNHTSKLPFSCGQCNVRFKVKEDYLKHAETAHNGIIHVQNENGSGETVTTINNADASTSANDPLQDTVIQYILEPSEQEIVNENEQPQYTIISDMSNYEAQTVLEDSKTRILSTTQNEDGTTTLMVTTDDVDEDEINTDQNTVVYLQIPTEEGTEQTVIVKQDTAEA